MASSTSSNRAPIAILNKRLSGEEEWFPTHAPRGMCARPDSWNMLLWHFVIDGPENTPYEGGQYYGIVSFTERYPFSEPKIQILTPNGFVDEHWLSVDKLLGRDWTPSTYIWDLLSGLRETMAGDRPYLGGDLMWDNQIREELVQESRLANNQLREFRSAWPHLFAFLSYVNV